MEMIFRVIQIKLIFTTKVRFSTLSLFESESFWNLEMVYYLRIVPRPNINKQLLPAQNRPVMQANFHTIKEYINRQPI